MPNRRRRFTSEFKLKVVGVYESGAWVAAAAKPMQGFHGLDPEPCI